MHPVQTADLNAYVGTSEASHILGISGSAVKTLFDAGKLTGLRSPIGRLVSRESLERLRIERAARRTSPSNERK